MTIGDGVKEINKYHYIMNDIIIYSIPGSIFLILFFLSDVEFNGCNIYFSSKINVLLSECPSVTISTALAGLIILLGLPYFLGHVISFLADFVRQGLSDRDVSKTYQKILLKGTINLEVILKQYSYYKLMKNMVIVFSLLIISFGLYSLSNFYDLSKKNYCSLIRECQTQKMGAPDKSTPCYGPECKKEEDKNIPDFKLNFTMLFYVIVILYILLGAVSWLSAKAYLKEYKETVSNTYAYLNKNSNS